MFQWFVGIDWGTEEHQIVVVDTAGREVDAFRVRHDGEDIERFVAKLVALAAGDLATIAVAIEATSSAIFEALLERGFSVFALNPKQLDRFRDRHSVAGAKDDRRDAYVAATSLRTDASLFRRLELGDPKLVKLRELSRAREELGADINALANRLMAQLRRYFPQMLELGSPHVDGWLLELLELTPTPRAVRHLKRAKLEALLRRAHVRRFDVDAVLATLRKQPLPVAPGVADAASAHAGMLLPRLRLAIDLRKQATRRLEELLEELSRPEGATDDSGPKPHRDAAILLSLPGAGSVVGATMLAEATNALAARDYHALRAICGVAPVTSQTGKQRQNGPHKPLVSMRRACNHRLRNAMHNWAGVVIQLDPRLRSLYARMRGRGLKHARALRGVADRLLAMLVAMLRTASVYDADRRLSADAPPMRRRARRRAEQACPVTSADRPGPDRCSARRRATAGQEGCAPAHPAALQ
jgi:transposase